LKIVGRVATGPFSLSVPPLRHCNTTKWVEPWLNWFRERATVGVDGVISTVENSSATIEKLYFDGPSADDWPAFAQYRNSFVPALGANHVFLPGQ
jgi:hypothetical protein